jgi:hypothetical protein
VEVQVNPPVFNPAEGFEITVIGGTPPFTFDPLTVPPNPPGVEVEPSGPSAAVSVPIGTPGQTVVGVRVTDSSVPPVVRIARATVRPTIASPPPGARGSGGRSRPGPT